MALEKILVAYDGSTGSQKALAWALELAGKLNIQTILAAVVTEPLGWSRETEPDILVRASEVQRQQLTKLLSDAADQFTHKGLTVATCLEDGSPGDELIECAKREEVDLIVSGTRGYGSSAPLMLGSVAHKLVTYSPIPVVIIK